MAGPLDEEMEQSLNEAREKARGYASGAEGQTGLEIRLNAIEQNLLGLARVVDNAFSRLARLESELSERSK
jgi:hypothetical protein